jgi:hypothetical protein
MLLHKPYVWHFVAHALLTSLCIASQQPLPRPEKENGPFDEDFGRLANDALQRWKCPGLSIAVVDGNHTWAAVSD